jgi:hypothetical protein
MRAVFLCLGHPWDQPLALKPTERILNATEQTLPSADWGNNNDRFVPFQLKIRVDKSVFYRKAASGQQDTGLAIDGQEAGF